MKWLVDAQPPRRLVHLLREHGHDVVHTLDLPDGNHTTDTAILAVAGGEDRVVVTKDADFVYSFIFRRQPRQLLLIATGNISDRALEAVLLRNLSALVNAFAANDFVELTPDTLIIHT